MKILSNFIPIILLLFLIGKTSYAQEENSKTYYDSLARAYHDSLLIDLQSWVGKPFPKFDVITISGDNFDEKKLLGKSTFIFYWFTSCAPCKAAFEEYNQLQDTSKTIDNLQLLSFTTDDESTAKQTALEEKFKFPIVSESSLMKNYPKFNYGFPLYFIVDNLGIIRFVRAGGYIDEIRRKNFFYGEIVPELENIVKAIDKTH